MPKPLSAEHRAKIAAGMRRYHAGCRKKVCKCPPEKKYFTARTNKPARKYPPKPRVLKRLRRAGTEPDVKKRSRRRYPKTEAGAALAKSLQRKGPLKRLRRAGVKKPKAAAKTAKKKPRRVALTKAARPKTAMVQRSLTSGQVSEYRAVRRLGKKSKKLRGKDAAPDLAFSIGGMYADA